MTAPARASAGERQAEQEAERSIARHSALDWALWYAHLGYAVLPLLPNSKVPATRNGLKDATRDPEQIKAWWSANPNFNVGILAPENVLVLDVDDPEVLPDLFATYPVLLEAPLHSTPSGGAHIFLRVPDGWTMPARVQAIPGVDVRGLGRAYVVAPPSRIISQQVPS